MEDGIENNRISIYDTIKKDRDAYSNRRMYVCAHDNGIIKDCIITLNSTIAQELLNKKYTVSIFIEDSLDLYKFSSELNK
jgi:hypothetical protein